MLTGGGSVLGLFPNAPYEELDIQLQRGDILLLYTDGFSEAMNPVGEEWGENRMIAEARRIAHLPASQILSGLFVAVDGFVAGADQHDGMTLLIMKVEEAADSVRS
jgi:sigma-B regulation protein RsbU (phosphoserine phosphatase)